MVPLKQCCFREVPASSALWPGVYQLMPPLFLLHTFNIAPSSLLPSSPAQRSEGCGFVFFSSIFEIAAPASSSRTTTENGHGLGCCCPELLHCSCVGLSSTMGSLTQHRAPRSWLMPGRTWAPWWAKAAAALDPNHPWKCCSQQLHFRKCLWLR